jgi:hypothetical protein
MTSPFSLPQQPAVVLMAPPPPPQLMQQQLMQQFMQQVMPQLMQQFMQEFMQPAPFSPQSCSGSGPGFGFGGSPMMGPGYPGFGGSPMMGPGYPGFGGLQGYPGSTSQAPDSPSGNALSAALGSPEMTNKQAFDAQMAVRFPDGYHYPADIQKMANSSDPIEQMLGNWGERHPEALIENDTLAGIGNRDGFVGRQDEDESIKNLPK